MTRIDFEDFLSDVIDDSVDMDWTGRDAAKLIMLRLDDAEQLTKILEILPDYTDSVWDQ